MATWGTLMSFFLCLLLFSGLLWDLVVVPAVLPPMVGCAVDIYHVQFTSLVLHMALVYPCSHSGSGECKSAGFTGLTLAWYAAEPLYCAPCTHKYTHTCMAQHSGAVRIPPYGKRIKQAAELRTTLSQQRWGPMKWVTGVT